MDGLGLIGAGRDARGTQSGAKGGRQTLAMIEKIGFVQVDSINVVERAHHHILWTRVPGYRASMLEGLLERGKVFEQWTHDASVIPSKWFAHWKPRFESRGMGSWVKQRLGTDGERVVEMVRRRVEAEGPLMAKHFDEGEHGAKGSGGWWEWKPSKAALEHLWRVGELCVAGRVNFHKVYDLTERVLADVHAAPTPSEEDHVKWACRTALERLGVATPREVSQFWNAIDQKRATQWCEHAARSGEILAVTAAACDGSKEREGFALPGWKRRAERTRDRLSRDGAGGRSLRLLSPFDPLIRDRARCRRLFGFEYQFEAFVPEKKRKYGYYVLPILDGDRLIGRLHPLADRKAGKLIVKGVWWEKGVRETKTLRTRLGDALTEYAAFNGVHQVEIR